MHKESNPNFSETGLLAQKIRKNRKQIPAKGFFTCMHSAGIVCQPRSLYSYPFLGTSRFRYHTAQWVQAQNYM